MNSNSHDSASTSTNGRIISGSSNDSGSKSCKVALRIAAAFLALGSALAATAQQSAILVQSTTSTANSGLYQHLLPDFQTSTGITVNVVAVGTGQAMRNARNCDADVLLVHAKAAEEKFVASGFGVERFDLMYNDFVIVAPANDPAAVRGTGDVVAAFTIIAKSGSLFASRGDDSGTHKIEQELWLAAGIDADAASGTWYRSTGSGMGATLNTGIGLGAYVLTDRATWMSFKNKVDYEIVVEGDKRLFNQYGVILVNKYECPNTRSEAGQVFVDWLLSNEGQDKIASHKIAGKQLFFPNADSTDK